VNRES